MIDLWIKDRYFDRQVAMQPPDKAQREVLSRAGAFIRTATRTSIRLPKGTSKPGHPPHSHTGLLRRFILSGYDRHSDPVVVGPVGFERSKGPHVLESGGLDGRPRWWRMGRSKLRIRTRPFIGPALKKKRDKLPALQAGRVRS